jgi:hypothetical protein
MRDLAARAFGARQKLRGRFGSERDGDADGHD